MDTEPVTLQEVKAQEMSDDHPHTAALPDRPIIEYIKHGQGATVYTAGASNDAKALGHAVMVEGGWRVELAYQEEGNIDTLEPKREETHKTPEGPPSVPLCTGLHNSNPFAPQHSSPLLDVPVKCAEDIAKEASQNPLSVPVTTPDNIPGILPENVSCSSLVSSALGSCPLCPLDKVCAKQRSQMMAHMVRFHDHHTFVCYGLKFVICRLSCMKGGRSHYHCICGKVTRVKLMAYMHSKSCKKMKSQMPRGTPSEAVEPYPGPVPRHTSEIVEGKRHESLETSKNYWFVPVTIPDNIPGILPENVSCSSLVSSAVGPCPLCPLDKVKAQKPSQMKVHMVRFHDHHTFVCYGIKVVICRLGCMKSGGSHYHCICGKLTRQKRLAYLHSKACKKMKREIPQTPVSVKFIDISPAPLHADTTDPVECPEDKAKETSQDLSSVQLAIPDNIPGILPENVSCSSLLSSKIGPCPLCPLNKVCAKRRSQMKAHMIRFHDHHTFVCYGVKVVICRLGCMKSGRSHYHCICGKVTRIKQKAYLHSKACRKMRNTIEPGEDIALESSNDALSVPVFPGHVHAGKSARKHSAVLCTVCQTLVSKANIKRHHKIHMVRGHGDYPAFCEDMVYISRKAYKKKSRKAGKPKKPMQDSTMQKNPVCSEGDFQQPNELLYSIETNPVENMISVHSVDHTTQEAAAAMAALNTGLGAMETVTSYPIEPEEEGAEESFEDPLSAPVSPADVYPSTSARKHAAVTCTVCQTLVSKANIKRHYRTHMDKKHEDRQICCVDAKLGLYLVQKHVDNGPNIPVYLGKDGIVPGKTKTIKSPKNGTPKKSDSEQSKPTGSGKLQTKYIKKTAGSKVINHLATAGNSVPEVMDAPKADPEAEQVVMTTTDLERILSGSLSKPTLIKCGSEASESVSCQQQTSQDSMITWKVEVQESSIEQQDSSMQGQECSMQQISVHSEADFQQTTPANSEHMYAMKTNTGENIIIVNNQDNTPEGICHPQEGDTHCHPDDNMVIIHTLDLPSHGPSDGVHVYTYSSTA